MRIALLINRKDLVGLVGVPLGEDCLQPGFVEVEVGQGERRIFKSGGDDHRHVGRFGRRDRIERIMW